MIDTGNELTGIILYVNARSIFNPNWMKIPIYQEKKKAEEKKEEKMAPEEVVAQPDPTFNLYDPSSWWGYFRATSASPITPPEAIPSIEVKPEPIKLLPQYDEIVSVSITFSNFRIFSQLHMNGSCVL